MPRKIDPADLEIVGGYEIRELKRVRKLRIFNERLDVLYGVDCWGYPEVAKLKREFEEARIAKGTDVTGTRQRKQAVRYSERVERKFKEYMKGYEKPAPNDIATLKHLCQLEILIEDAQLKLQGVLGADEFKKYSDVLRGLSTDHLKLQQALGITLRDREEQATGLDDVRDYVMGAKAMVDRLAIPVECAACQAKKIKINIMLVINHFRGYIPVQIITVCPKCGADIIIQEKATKRPETIPSPVKAEE